MIPAWPVWASIALQAIVWLSTVAIQVPIQLRLSADGQSLPLLEHLIVTNFWLRRIPYGLCAALFVWMASKVMTESVRDRRGSDARNEARLASDRRAR